MGFSTLTIEIVGAFIGIFGGISLGELAKIYNISRDSKNIVLDLVKELTQAKQVLSGMNDNPIAIPLWMSLVNSGLLYNLPDRPRQLLIEAYRAIEIYNNREIFQDRNTTLRNIERIIDKLAG